MTDAPIVAIDDVEEDLDRLEAAYPGRLIPLHVDLTADGGIVAAHEAALVVLRVNRPAALILDMRWQEGSDHFDGLRLLREACEEGLLAGVRVVCWTRYQDELRSVMTGVFKAMADAGVADVCVCPKPVFPPL